jgi:hypothetical protein
MEIALQDLYSKAIAEGFRLRTVRTCTFKKYLGCCRGRREQCPFTITLSTGSRKAQALPGVAVRVVSICSYHNHILNDHVAQENLPKRRRRPVRNERRSDCLVVIRRIFNYCDALATSVPYNRLHDMLLTIESDVRRDFCNEARQSNSMITGHPDSGTSNVHNHPHLVEHMQHSHSHSHSSSMPSSSQLMQMKHLSNNVLTHSQGGSYEDGFTVVGGHDEQHHVDWQTHWPGDGSLVPAYFMDNGVHHPSTGNSLQHSHNHEHAHLPTPGGSASGSGAVPQIPGPTAPNGGGDTVNGGGNSAKNTRGLGGGKVGSSTPYSGS